MKTINCHRTQKKVRIPALSEHTFLRYFNFAALYIAQGIPEGLLIFGIPAWMAANGKTPGEIGSFVAIVLLPWSFKIVVAPLMDRFTYLPMGRRRPWVLFGQLGLMVSFMAMAFVPDPLNNLHPLMAAGFAVGFFGAFQDVATDGMAIEIVPVHQQARANGFMWGAKTIGISVSLATGSWLLNYYDFTTAILSLSATVCLIMLIPLFLRERRGEKIMPWTAGSASEESQKIQAGSWMDIFKSLYKVFSLRNSLLFAVMIFMGQVAYGYFETILPVFTVQALGWTNQGYAQFYATANLIGGIGGMLIGGILIDKFGKIRMLNIYFFLLIVLISSMAFLKTFWQNTTAIAMYMICYQIFYTFSTIGVFAIAMQFCWKKVSATQFTLYMAISNLGMSTGAKLIGPIKEHFDWQFSILFPAIILLISWSIFQFISIIIQEKRVAEIHQKDMEVHLAVVG